MEINEIIDLKKRNAVRKKKKPEAQRDWKRPYTTLLVGWLVGWLVGFYGISTFVGYLTPNPFLYK